MKILPAWAKVTTWLKSPKIPIEAKRKLLAVALDVIANTEIYYKKGGEVGVRYKKTW